MTLVLRYSYNFGELGISKKRILVKVLVREYWKLLANFQPISRLKTTEYLLVLYTKYVVRTVIKIVIV